MGLFSIAKTPELTPQRRYVVGGDRPKRLTIAQ